MQHAEIGFGLSYSDADAQRVLNKSVDEQCCNHSMLLHEVIYESIVKVSHFHFLDISMIPAKKGEILTS